MISPEGNTIKRTILSSALILILAMTGCGKLYGPTHPIPVSLPIPVPTPTLTVTPTPVTTPVCGFKDLGISMYWGAGAGKTYVIPDAATWIADNGVSATAPAVDFSAQMILEVSDEVISGCDGSSTWPSINSVCVFYDHIEVDYQLSKMIPIPTPVVTPGEIPIIRPICNSISYFWAQDSVAIPKSDLPVLWIAK